MYHKVNKRHLRTRHILRQKMLPFKFGLGTQLRVLPELGCTKHPRTQNGKGLQLGAPMFHRVHAVKHCNPFSSSSPALRKPSWTGSRKNPSRGGRQQPHQTLEKFKKYKGGKKHHTMVTQSAPKMPKWHHSALKA